MNLRQLTPTFGVEVSGIDLGAAIAESDAAELQRAFIAHKLIVLRNQHVTTEQFVNFTGIFGALQEAPRRVVNPTLNQNVNRHASRIVHERAEPGTPENTWHADSTNHAEPELGGALRAIELPPIGGDTLFADMHAVFAGLDPRTQEQVLSLRAVHDVAVMSRRNQLSTEASRELREIFPPVEHPVIRTHPVSGERAVFVNTVWTSHITGLARDESDALLAMLFRQATKPEYQYRLVWTEGSLAVWDNRIVQHYATADYGEHRRVMERVSIKGDRPA
jgi:taurine dioxygenase